MANNYLEKYLTSLAIIRESQVDTALKSYLTSLRMAVTKKQNDKKCCCGEPFLTVDWSINCSSHWEISMEVPQKSQTRTNHMIPYMYSRSGIYTHWRYLFIHPCYFLYLEFLPLGRPKQSTAAATTRSQWQTETQFPLQVHSEKPTIFLGFLTEHRWEVTYRVSLTNN